ncbi:MBL fold metallo-hydrolase [Pseudactinotalea sp. Z1748]|uniref:MBL fold metallo-hydrolase n=1 Tax=Pseudactinotalea sp. Z1748 TaxID=3413027 RepID=UPI003C7CB9CE
MDNNVWVLGDDAECVVIDAPHEAGPILELIGSRRLVAVRCTHAHDDHITAVGALHDATGAPTYLHPRDRMLWDRVYEVGPDLELADGQLITVAGVDIHVLHTPGHSPGACCFLVHELDVVFTGDTMFAGGPGATGHSFSSFDTIIDSVTEKLLTLPWQTTVHTGHGPSTTIAPEAPHRQEWIDRGH